MSSQVHVHASSPLQTSAANATMQIHGDRSPTTYFRSKFRIESFIRQRGTVASGDGEGEGVTNQRIPASRQGRARSSDLGGDARGLAAEEDRWWRGRTCMSHARGRSRVEFTHGPPFDDTT